MTSDPTVFVIDDDAAVRKGLRVLIKSVGLRVEAFGSAAQYLEGLDPSRAGCLVLDVRIPGMSGLDLQGCLADRGVSTPIIFLSAHGDVPMAVRAVKKGALDFLEKPFRHQELLDLIHRALEEDARVRQQQREREGVRARLEDLSQREREVLNRVVAGAPNKAIAADLGISEKTVEFHRAHVMQKMGASSLADLVRMALLAAPTQGSPQDACG